MADKQMYVWSPIVHGDKTIKLGEKVSKADLEGLADEDWDYLVEAGSVRPHPYPVHDNGKVITNSPRLHALNKVAEAANDVYVADRGTSRETVTAGEAPKDEVKK